MRYLELHSTKRISKIGLGTWQFGANQWGSHYGEKEIDLIIRRAVELGVTLFDTAEIYGAGRSERILGRALGDRLESVALATKLWPLVPAASIVRQRARASARRLGARYLDLYQVHWSNPMVSDRAIMRGMRSLQSDGLVVDVGVSSYSLGRWCAAEHALGGRILSNQVGYSLVSRAPELDLLPFAERNGRVIIAHSPLARGLLAGRYHDPDLRRNSELLASRSPRAGDVESTETLVAVLREVAAARRATPAQIALSWAIRSPAVVAIPGASSIRQLEENVAAADIELAQDEYKALNQASDLFCPIVPADASVLSPGRLLTVLRHSAKCAWYLAKTIRADHVGRPIEPVVTAARDKISMR